MFFTYYDKSLDIEYSQGDDISMAEMGHSKLDSGIQTYGISKPAITGSTFPNSSFPKLTFRGINFRVSSQLQYSYPPSFLGLWLRWHPRNSQLYRARGRVKTHVTVYKAAVAVDHHHSEKHDTNEGATRTSSNRSKMPVIDVYRIPWQVLPGWHIAMQLIMIQPTAWLFYEMAILEMESWH